MLTSLSPDLLYLVVFGPGFGESILLRVPPSDWVVVDCCMSGAFCPPLDLLRAHNARWSCLVLTHPHTDHSNGLDQVIHHGGEGPVGCVPVWFTSSQWEKSPDPERHLAEGINEHVLAAIDDRWDKDPKAHWELQQGDARKIGGALLTPLWPDKASISESDRIKDPNRLSTPILVEWEELRILLGADLPAGPWAQIGGLWSDLGKHAALKVPHHGPTNSISAVFAAGEPERLWVITPWNRGPTLPRFEDGQGVDRLLDFVKELNLTGLPSQRETIDQRAFQVSLPVIQQRGKYASSCIAAGFDREGKLCDIFCGPGSVVIRRP